jgi:hypothetical protein
MVLSSIVLERWLALAQVPWQRKIETHPFLMRGAAN